MGRVKTVAKHLWKHKFKYGAASAVPVIYGRGFLTGVAFRSYNPRIGQELRAIRKEQSEIRKEQSQRVIQQYPGGKL